ncbi:hypothetical protein KUTeg_022055, partial [Tegillarca granosa]
KEPELRSHFTAILLTENSYFSRDQWNGVRKTLVELGNNMKKYADYLREQKTRTFENSSKTVSSEKQKWEVLSSKHHITPGPLSRYQSLRTAIILSDNYVPILVNDHAPGDPNRRHYMFCITKYGKTGCSICKLPSLSANIFESLHFLPDPEPENAEKYKSFKDLYGKITSEKYRPSLKSCLKIP